MLVNQFNTLSLIENQVAIWFLFLPSQYESVEQMLPFLSDEEINRMNKYYFHEDQVKFAICRYHLKWLLSQYLAQELKNIAIGYGPHSKPFLAHKNYSHFKFNISHSGDMAAYAFSLGYEVGVDIEKYNVNVKIMGMSKKYFSRAEDQVLNAAGGSDMASLFYNIWTCKEAYLKYKGMGLKLPINSFSIYPRSETLLSLLPCYEKIQCSQQQKSSYFAALCTPYKNPEIFLHYII